METHDDLVIRDQVGKRLVKLKGCINKSDYIADKTIEEVTIEILASIEPTLEIDYVATTVFDECAALVSDFCTDKNIDRIIGILSKHCCYSEFRSNITQEYLLERYFND